MPKQTESRSEKRLKSNFALFVWYVFTKFLVLPSPTRVQKDICKWLQHGPRRRMVQAFRGVGKSWLTALFVVWMLWKNPQIKIMIVSATEQKAIEISTFIRNIIELVPDLHHLRPKSTQRDSMLAFDVGPARPAQAPSIRAAGILGQLTGGRADIILADDIEIPKNSDTEIKREQLENATREFAAIMSPGTEVVYLGTPQTAESIYTKLPEKGYTIRVWPARYPTEANRGHYDDCLAPMLLNDLKEDPDLAKCIGSMCGGAPTDPARFYDEDLQEREGEYAKSGFMLQFMLDTRLSDADRHPLKLRDMIVLDLNPDIAPVKVAWASSPDLVVKDLSNPGFTGDRFHRPMYVSDEWTEYTGAVMIIDPSGRGADECGYCVTKFLHGMVYCTAWGGYTSGYDDETLEGLVKTAKDHKVKKIMVESNFGDGMFTKLLQPWLNRIYPCTVEEYKVTGQKERRIIDKLEPVLNQHRLVMDGTVLARDLQADDKRRGCYQLTHLTAERGALRHDDRVEVLAEACAYWTQHLGWRTEDSEKRHAEKLKDQMVKEFVKDARGSVPRRRGSRRGRARRLRQRA